MEVLESPIGHIYGSQTFSTFDLEKARYETSEIVTISTTIQVATCIVACRCDVNQTLRFSLRTIVNDFWNASDHIEAEATSYDRVEK